MGELGVIIECYTIHKPILAGRFAAAITANTELQKALLAWLSERQEGRRVGHASGQLLELPEDARFDSAHVACATLIPDLSALDAMLPPAASWTPLVVVAHQGKGELVASKEPLIRARHPGAAIWWLDLEDAPGSDAHPLWPSDLPPETRQFDVLAPEKVVPAAIATRLVGNLTPIEIEIGEGQPSDRVLIVDLTADWAHRTKTRVVPKVRTRTAAATSSKIPDELRAFSIRLQDAIRSRTGDVILWLKPGSSIEELVPQIREALNGKDFRVLSPEPAVPLLSQLDTWSRRDQMEIKRLVSVANKAVPSPAKLLQQAASEALVTESVEKRIAISRGGETVGTAQLVADNRRRVARLVSHGFDRLAESLSKGLYRAETADESGAPQESWLGKKEWTKSVRDTIPNWFGQKLNAHDTIYSAPEAREEIAERIANYLTRELALLSLLFELLWAGLIIESVVRYLTNTFGNDLAGTDSTGLPAPLRRTANTASLRASAMASSDRILAAARQWPFVEKVPSRVNVNIVTKSIQTLFRQGTKLVAAVAVALPILGLAGFLGSGGGKSLNQLFTTLSTSLSIDVMYVMVMGSLAIVIAVAIMIWVGRDNLRARREPLFNKLRDETYAAIELAATNELKLARTAFEQVVERDLRELERQIVSITERVLAERASATGMMAERAKATLARLKDDTKKLAGDSAAAEKERNEARKQSAKEVERKLHPARAGAVS
ncbi:hypothetical protein RLEG3_12320 [Rhizobium leguminosarum bv. trifolii WSM1689]|uniref:hypothetical protein n=1 Tax=Rhizobium leguminosarum TaxID=384 RepID=UPI0003E0A49E|nr:hypothetical protein [Rhizobium leguminosarum]AHF86636.1 hypothetical protein RLEG3_12320 [Rhizobium leguminosarum bv. trifolii WSM1689]